MEVIFLIIWTACSFATWYIYHKIFDVMYFNLFNGCLKEIITSSFIGLFLTLLIIKFWYISIIVIALFLIVFFKKKG